MAQKRIWSEDQPAGTAADQAALPAEKIRASTTDVSPVGPAEAPAKSPAENIRASTTDVSPVSPAESTAQAVRRDETTVIKRDRILAEIKVQPPDWSRSQVFVLAGLLISGLCALFVLGQLVQVWANIGALHPYARFFVIAFLLAVLALIFYSLQRLLSLYFSIPYGAQISYSQIDMTEKNVLWQAAAFEEGRTYLKKYLESYRGGFSEYLDSLSQLGMSEENREKLGHYRNNLMRDRSIEAEAWIKEFRRGYLKLLEDTAQRRSRHYAAIVAMKTAISPWPFLDIAAIIYNSFQLTRELCVIFNRRASKLAAFYLLSRIGFNTYIGGHAQEFMQQGAGHIVNSIRQEMEVSAAELENVEVEAFADGFRGGVASGPAKLLFGKAAEGGLNYLLTLRLGRRAVRYLTPLVES